MTTDTYLRILRRKLSDVDPGAQRRSDQELLQYTADVNLENRVRKVTGASLLTVDTDQRSASYGFSPEPTDEYAMLLVIATAIDLLWEKYTQRLDRGELGTVWKSGLEEMSTIAAEKAYRARIEAVETELEELMLIVRSPEAGTRPQ